MLADSRERMSLPDKKPALCLAMPDPWLTTVVWFLYTLFLLFIALPQGLSTQIAYGDHFTVLSLPVKLGGDAGYYIEGAQEILQKGWFGSYWFFNLWSPGFFWLEAIIIKCVGLPNLLPSLFVLVASLWSGAFVLLWKSVRDALGWWSLLWLPLPFIAFGFFRNYLLRDGVLMSESVSLSLWACGSLILLQAMEKRALLKGACAGVFFAAAAYIRGNLELVAVIASLMTVILLAGNFCWLLLRKKSLIGRSLGVATLSAVIAFHALTIPWRLHNYAVRNDMQWQRIDYYWELLFTSDADMATKWYIDAGTPVAYHCDPAFSDNARNSNKLNPGSVNFQKMAVQVFLHHPLPWIAYKLKKLPRFWLDLPEGCNFSDNMLIPFLGAFGFVSLLLRRRYAPNAVMLGLYLSALLAQIVAGLFVHYEPRYFYFLKSQMIFAAILGLAALLRKAMPKPMPAD